MKNTIMSPETQTNSSSSSTVQSASSQPVSNQTVATQIDLPVLWSGLQGRAVILLQQLLEAQSYRTGGADGIFGARTEQAVRTYQKNFGNCST